MARKWLNLFAGAALSSLLLAMHWQMKGKSQYFAAASLTNAMQDIATQYKKEKGVDVVSSALRHLLSPVRLKRVPLRICCYPDEMDGVCG